MEAALPIEYAPMKGKLATFGTASLVFGLLTVVLPVAVMIFFGHKAEQAEQARDSHGWAPIIAVLTGVVFSFIASGLSSVAGTITGVVALIRGESHTWRPVVGLIVNAPVFAILAYAVIAARMSNGG